MRNNRKQFYEILSCSVWAHQSCTYLNSIWDRTPCKMSSPSPPRTYGWYPKTTLISAKIYELLKNKSLESCDSMQYHVTSGTRATKPLDAKKDNPIRKLEGILAWYFTCTSLRQKEGQKKMEDESEDKGGNNARTVEWCTPVSAAYKNRKCAKWQWYTSKLTTLSRQSKSSVCVNNGRQQDISSILIISTSSDEVKGKSDKSNPANSCIFFRDKEIQNSNMF